MTGFPVFTGNCPGNVSKDAKYAIRTVSGGSVVALTYDSKDGERWFASTERHPRLVEMVNAVKTTQGDRPNGPFYLNEFRQVIVPVGRGATYYLAGEYEERLEFEFEGKVLTGRAVDLEGLALRPGDTWVGPHAGIPYVLAAGGNDIYFQMSPRPNVTRKVTLSSQVGAEPAKDLATELRATKGFAGGRFYINEWRELFAPLATAGAWGYVYLGSLATGAPWFEKRSINA